MSTTTPDPVIDFWAAHPKKYRRADLCCSPFFSFLVERDTHLRDRKGVRRDYGATWSDGTWGLHPKLARKEPGLVSTCAAWLIRFSHPYYRFAINKGGRGVLQNSAKEESPVLITETDLEWLGKVSKLYLKSWLANGPITFDAYKKLKFELMHEMQDMKRKGLLTIAEYQTFRMNALQFEMNFFLRQGLISVADYNALKADLGRFDLEDSQQKDDAFEKKSISDPDFDQLQEDLLKVLGA